MEEGEVLTREDIMGIREKSIPDFLASRISRRGSPATMKRMIAPVYDRQVLSTFPGLETEDGLRKEGLIADILPSEPSSSFSSENSLVRPIITPFNSNNLDVDGIDFTMGKLIYEADTILGRVSPKGLEKLGVNKRKLKMSEQFVVRPGKIYYVASEEKVALPETLDIFIDSKSTIGRLGCICGDATITQSLRRSPKNLMVVVAPDFFPLRFTSGKSRLFQGIFKYVGNSHMTREELLDTKEIEIFVRGEKRALIDCLDEDKLTLHVSTRKAYVSKRNLENVAPISVDGCNLDWRKYYEEVEGNSQLVLEPGRLYLLGTKEYLRLGNVCGRIGRALPSYLAGLWVQFAGIAHAGFYGEVTLECKTDRKVRIRDGDLFGYLQLDKLSRGVDLKGLKMSYANQKAPKLPKIFKTD